jgi:Tfp pilus assembly protein FimV
MATVTRNKSANRPFDAPVIARLGFRRIIDRDGDLRVVHGGTAKPYARPDEAQAEAEARQAESEARQNVERRLQELEAELERLRGVIRQRKKNGR